MLFNVTFETNYTFFPRVNPAELEASKQRTHAAVEQRLTAAFKLRLDRLFAVASFMFSLISFFIIRRLEVSRTFVPWYGNCLS